MSAFAVLNSRDCINMILEHSGLSALPFCAAVSRVFWLAVRDKQSEWCVLRKEWVLGKEATGLLEPCHATAVCGSDTVCVLDAGGTSPPRLQVLGPTGAVLRTAALLLPPGDPRCVVIERDQLHVIDASSCKIWTLEATLGGPPTLEATLAAPPPAGVAHMEQVQCRALANTGSRGEGRGQMWLPRALAIVGDALFVADTFNHRVVKFTRSARADGTAPRARRWRFSRAFGSYGAGSAQFNKPWSLCALERQLLIVDRNNHRLLLTTLTGKHVRTIGGAGALPGRFRYPCCAAVASRVARHTPTAVQPASQGPRIRHASCCRRRGPIFHGRHGHIYAAEETRIQVFTRKGVPLQLLSAAGLGRVAALCASANRLTAVDGATGMLHVWRAVRSHVGPDNADGAASSSSAQ